VDHESDFSNTLLDIDDRILVENVDVEIREIQKVLISQTFSGTSATPELRRWNGIFPVLNFDLVVGDSYRLNLEDGRTGEILMKGVGKFVGNGSVE